MKSTCFVATDAAQDGGSVELCDEEEKRRQDKKRMSCGNCRVGGQGAARVAGSRQMKAKAIAHRCDVLATLPGVADNRRAGDRESLATLISTRQARYSTLCRRPVAQVGDFSRTRISYL